MSDDKITATAMYLTSVAGSKQEEIPEASRLHVLTQWFVTRLSMSMDPKPGCAQWLREWMAGVDRLGQHWSWIRYPGVLYCSQECVLKVMYLHKNCFYECDICDKHGANPFILQIGEIAVMTMCCEMCGGYPEGFAHLN
jgi:hypothetical protein